VEGWHRRKRLRATRKKLTIEKQKTNWPLGYRVGGKEAKKVASGEKGSACPFSVGEKKNLKQKKRCNHAGWRGKLGRALKESGETIDM